MITFLSVVTILSAQVEWTAEPLHTSSESIISTTEMDNEDVEMVHSDGQSSKEPLQSDQFLLSSNNVQKVENAYTIQKGDCLWDLAFKFLGNPFQWPRIWQANVYIKNPDLIYPGDILKIPGRDEYISINQSSAGSDTSGRVTQGVVSSGYQSVLVSKTRSLLRAVSQQQNVFNSPLQSGAGNSANDSIALIIGRAKQQMSKSFFASAPFMCFYKNKHGEYIPGNSTVKTSDKAMYQLYDRVRISIKRDEIFKVGDTLDFYTRYRMVSYKRKTGAIVRCVAKAVVTEIMKNEMEAEVYKIFDRISGGESVAKSIKTGTFEIDTLVTPDVPIRGEIFTRVEETSHIYLFQTLIIDRGIDDGVELGDVFAIYRAEKNKLSSKASGIGFIGNVQNTTSSLILLKMSDKKISQDDKALLIRRTVFSGGQN
jgi:hypothetical protein